MPPLAAAPLPPLPAPMTPFPEVPSGGGVAGFSSPPQPASEPRQSVINAGTISLTVYLVVGNEWKTRRTN